MTNPQIKAAMAKYAKAHAIPIPTGFNPAAPAFLGPAKCLAGRIQSHAKLPVTWDASQKLIDLLIPMSPQQRVREALAHGYENIMGAAEGGSIQKQIAAHSHIGVNDAWCAAGFDWVLDERTPYNGPRPGAVAWVPAWEQLARQHKIVVPAAQAKRGMGVTFVWSGRKGTPGDHIGVIAQSYGAAHQVKTYECNAGPYPDAVRTEWRAWWQVNLVFDIARLTK